MSDYYNKSRHIIYMAHSSTEHDHLRVNGETIFQGVQRMENSLLSRGEVTQFRLRSTWQEHKVFGLEIFVQQEVLDELEDTETWFAKLKRAAPVESLRFNSDLTIPDLEGRNIQIYDSQMWRKYQCCMVMLSDVYRVFQKIKGQTFSIIVFVPEGMVSLLIGAKGHQINKIMKDSGTSIVVNQPISRMTYRTVKIKGYHSDVARACKIIYEILQDKSSIAHSIEKEPFLIDLAKAKVKAKLVFPVAFTMTLERKRRHFIRKVEHETRCELRIDSEDIDKLIRKEEEVCVLLGRLEDVHAMAVVLINLAHDYFSQQRKAEDYPVKLLIPANYVTKIIGQNGYMIKDIKQRSGEAQIKVLSDRMSERDARECLIVINGTRENKIDATCIIVEQIQCFKNGGPVLPNGRLINADLAQQFKNAISYQKEVSGQTDPIQLKTSHENSLEGPKKAFNSSETANDGHGRLEIKSEFVAKPEPQLLSLHNSHHSLCEDRSDEEGLIRTQEFFRLQVSQSQLREGGTNRGSASKQFSLQPVCSLSSLVQGRSQPYRKSRHQQSSPNERYDSSQWRSYQGHDDFRREKERNQSRGHYNNRSRSPQRDRYRRRNSSRSRSSSEQESEIKMTVSRQIGENIAELRYIESISHTQITVCPKTNQGSEILLTIRGTTKSKQDCVEMLQKRIARHRNG